MTLQVEKSEKISKVKTLAKKEKVNTKFRPLKIHKISLCSSILLPTDWYIDIHIRFYCIISAAVIIRFMLTYKIWLSILYHFKMCLIKK